MQWIFHNVDTTNMKPFGKVRKKKKKETWRRCGILIVNFEQI